MRSRPLSLAVFSFQPYRLSQLLSAIMVGGITILALPLHAQQQDEQRLSVEQRQACRSKAAQVADPEEQKRLFRKCRREILDQATPSSAPAAAPPVVAAHPSVATPAPVAAPTTGPVVAPTVAAAPSVAAPTTGPVVAPTVAAAPSVAAPTMGPVVAPTVAAAPSVAAPAPVSAPIAAAPAVSAAPVVPASVATPPTSNEPAANDLVEVVAQGMGTDANSALNNAYSNAVQQALGLYVDAETMVQNDQVVRDQILTYSRGFIQKTDTISQRQENGLFQVNIRAQVQRQKLLEKAKASNISVKPVQGATLYAQIKSQSKQVEDAGNLIKKAFEPLTKIDFYRAQIVGEPTVVKEKSNSETTVLEYKFILWVDEAQYLDYVNKQLIPVLDQIATHKDTVVVNIDKNKNNDDHLISYLYNYNYSNNSINVMVWRDKSINSSKWFVYNFSDENLKKIADILEKNKEEGQPIRITIDLLDENNQLIASNEGTTNNCRFCAIAYGFSNYYNYYLVAPFFDISGPRLRSMAFYFFRERAFQVKVSTEDLPRVKSVKLEFKPAAG